jgi:protocatechuate 3,4-dioxygenase beta subunit
MKTFLLLISTIFLYIDLAYANTPESILKERKSVTPLVVESDIYAKPDYFNNSNNLARKPGSPFLAQGESLRIEGNLNALFNVPIENATVCIWQTNSRGYYNHLVEDKMDATKYDADFAGNGCAITDNLGKFAFLTIMPTWYGNRAIHVHFLIWTEYLKHEVEVEMLFPNHPRNQIDNKYRQMDPKSRSTTTCLLRNINPENPLDGKIAYFNIKLDVLHPKKKY